MSEVVHTYRGFGIFKVTHSQPFLIRGRMVSEGYSITSEKGGVNLSPGCTWTESISESCKMIDNLILAGMKTPEDHGKLDADIFWGLMGNSGLNTDMSRGVVSLRPTVIQYPKSGQEVLKVKVCLDLSDGEVSIPHRGDMRDPHYVIALANALKEAAVLQLKNQFTTSCCY